MDPSLLLFGKHLELAGVGQHELSNSPKRVNPRMLARMELKVGKIDVPGLPDALSARLSINLKFPNSVRGGVGILH